MCPDDRNSQAGLLFVKWDLGERQAMVGKSNGLDALRDNKVESKNMSEIPDADFSQFS